MNSKTPKLDVSEDFSNDFKELVNLIDNSQKFISELASNTSGIKRSKLLDMEEKIKECETDVRKINYIILLQFKFKKFNLKSTFN